METVNYEGVRIDLGRGKVCSPRAKKGFVVVARGGGKFGAEDICWNKFGMTQCCSREFLKRRYEANKF